MGKTVEKGDHSTITPPNTLQKKVRKLTGRKANFDPIANAEQAVELLSVNFADWMDKEVQRLMDIWQTNKSTGFSGEARGALYRTAHDLRGEAATLGFPSVGHIAGVFCDILDAVNDNPVPDDFLEKYITAIRAIARETKAGEENAIAAALAEELSQAGAEMIDKVQDSKAA